MTAEELKEVTDFMRQHYPEAPHYFAMEVINMLVAMKQQTLREAAGSMCHGCSMGIPLDSSRTIHVDGLAIMRPIKTPCKSYPILAMMEEK